jgi:hypothetical protein
MTDVSTQRHRHDHDHDAAGWAPGHPHELTPAASARASLLETSAASRVLAVSIVCAALWAGVYWALH